MLRARAGIVKMTVVIKAARENVVIYEMTFENKIRLNVKTALLRTINTVKIMIQTLFYAPP